MAEEKLPTPPFSRAGAQGWTEVLTDEQLGRATWALSSPHCAQPAQHLGSRGLCPLHPHFNRDLPPLASLPQHVKPFKLQQLPALPSHLEAWPLASAPRHAQSPQTPA